MRKLSHEEILSRQAQIKEKPKLDFCVVLNNIRSLYNVGSIFRTADGAGVAKIYLCGITGSPPNNQISKTALGAEAEVPWAHHKEVIPLLKELKEEGYQLILLEQTDKSVSYADFSPEEKVCLILGHECEGVQDDIVPLCDQAIEIEMAGLKNSLNVSVAFGVIAYHFRNCLK